MHFILLILLALICAANAQQKPVTYSTKAAMASGFPTNSLERTIIVTDGSGMFLYTPSSSVATNSSAIAPIGGIGRFISISTGSGEANTASNLGSGTGLFNAKSGTDLQFNSLTGAGVVTVSSNASTITVTSYGGAAVDTLASLVALASPAGYTNVFVRGRAAAGDGGGGDFVYSASSGATTNMGTILGTANGSSSRWLRVFAGPCETLLVWHHGRGTRQRMDLLQFRRG